MSECLSESQKLEKLTVVRKVFTITAGSAACTLSNVGDRYRSVEEISSHNLVEMW